MDNKKIFGNAYWELKKVCNGCLRANKPNGCTGCDVDEILKKIAFLECKA